MSELRKTSAARRGRDSHVLDGPAGEGGFTLVETMVGLVITAEVFLVALLLFDVNSRLARNQVQVADMQQNQRIAHNELARMVRMAGRGGLRQQVAVVVTDDADPTANRVNGNSPIDGSDILTIRGVITSPMYQVSQTAGSYTPPSGGNLTGGQVIVWSVSPTGIRQAVDPFQDVIAQSTFGGRETTALVLVGANSDTAYAVVETTDIAISNTNQDIDGDGTNDTRVTIDFTANTGGGGLSQAFAQLNPTSGVFPPALAQANAVGWVGIVEEYRFYARDDTTAAGGFAPKLSRARFYPNTNRVWGEANATTTGVPNGRLDIAENVLDLQVAMGIDADGDGVIEEALDAANDEWWLNDGEDEATDFEATDLLYNLALTSLVRTDRFDRNFQSDPLSWIGNHEYAEPASPSTAQERLERSYRRQMLTTVIDLRNLN